MDDLTGLVLLALGWICGRFFEVKPKKKEQNVLRP